MLNIIYDLCEIMYNIFEIINVFCVIIYGILIILFEIDEFSRFIGKYCPAFLPTSQDLRLTNGRGF